MLYEGCSLPNPYSFPPSLLHSSAPRSPRPQALHKEVLCKFAMMLPSCEMCGQGDPTIMHLEDVYRRYIRCGKQGRLGGIYVEKVWGGRQRRAYG